MNRLRNLIAATLAVAMGATLAAGEAAAFDITLAIDPTGTVDQTGLATVTGTLICSEASSFAEVEVELIQPVGRKNTIRGVNFQRVDCNEPFEIPVIGRDGRFGPGTAHVRGWAFACNAECDDDSVLTTIRLRR